MGVGVGILKKSLGFDLNAAAFGWNLFDDETNKDTRVGKHIYGAMFRWSTAINKEVSIILQIDDTTIYEDIRFIPSTRKQWTWTPEVALPGNVNIIVKVTKTSVACTQQFVLMYR